MNLEVSALIDQPRRIHLVPTVLYVLDELVDENRAQIGVVYQPILTAFALFGLPVISDHCRKARMTERAKLDLRTSPTRCYLPDSDNRLPVLVVASMNFPNSKRDRHDEGIAQNV
jgi:hypothetical protein